MPNSKKKILVWGGKSQTRILLEFIDKKDKIIAIVDPFLKKNSFNTKIPFINNKKNFLQIVKKSNFFIVGIGGEYGNVRKKISEKLIDLGLIPMNVIHRNSYIDKTCKIGNGIQIMPGVNVNCFTKIGDYTILNTSSTIDHECVIGSGVHLMGNSYVGGRVIIEDNVTIGSNAIIFPDIKIEKGAFVGAGSVVRKNVKKNQIVVGNPAKFLKKKISKLNLGFLSEIK